MSDTTKPTEPAMNEASSAPEITIHDPTVGAPDQRAAEPQVEAAAIAPAPIAPAAVAPVGRSPLPGLAPSPTLAQSARDRGQSRRATSDAGALRSLGLAILFYCVAVLGATLSPASVRALLFERGWAPIVTVMITCVALAILVLKAFGLRKQRRAFAIDLLPDGDARIGTAAAARVVDHIRSLPSGRRAESFLLERVARVLSQYAARGDVAEASAANDADADADAASIAASFSTVKVLVWALPILGLIGTVVGLSGAVGSFSLAMSGAEQLDTIKTSLREVTTGLAVAFDTTFVALLASLLVMLPMTWLQKAEDKLINDVDDYCVTNVLARLAGHEQAAREERAPAAGLAAVELRQLVHDTLAQPLAEMLSANARTLERMTADRVALVGAQEALMAQLSAFAATLHQAAPGMERAVSQLGRATAEMGSSMERVVAQLDKTTAQVGPSLERVVVQLDRTTAQATQGMERAITEVARANDQVEVRVAPTLERAAGQIDRATTQLASSVERTLAQLERSAAVAEEAGAAAEHARDQLGRELGASRQLLSLLAAGLGATDAPPSKTRHANGANGTNGVNGTNGAAARGD